MNCYLLSLNPDADISKQWDFGFLKDFLDNNDFNITSVNSLPKDKKAIVVLPARHHANLVDRVNKELNKINHVVLFLMGDEEAEFFVEDIKHKSIHIWVQNPHPGRHDNYNKLGTGYPPHIKDNLPETVNKNISIYFAGQNTHARRNELIKILERHKKNDKNMLVVPTKGFTQGESHKEYYKHMTSAKIAPAPSGAVIPDSFRLFEALECMAIPLADNKCPDGTIYEYWDWLFGEAVPFPQITDWVRIFTIVPELLEDYPRNLHHQTAWWLQWKRNFKYKVIGQLNEK